LERDEQSLVSKTHDELKADCLHQIVLLTQQFTAKSAPANDLERKAEAVRSLAKNGLRSREELTDWLRSVEVASRVQLTIPADNEEALDRLVENQYNLKNRLLLLPEKIEETKRKLAQATQQRGLLKVSDEFDFETIPEIQELNILITRAEQNADQIASAIAWIEDLQTLDTPAFEQLVPASAERAIPDGNHQKLFVLAFGVTGLLLGLPVLLLDLLYTPMTATQRLGNELGLATIPTHEIMSRTSVNATLQVGDPELRLLALRIQQMAREARGSVVLFSSLADNVSTKELTTTLAQCLAARQEKVLMIDLESIEDNRVPSSAIKRLKVSANSKRTVVVASSAGAHGNGGVPGKLTGEIDSEDDHSLSGGKMGLAVALSGGAKVPEDVLIEHGDDGVDRVLLGSGELAVEAFATPLMGQLLETYRNAYSMVLLSGPAAKHLADVQMLAARCDGTLFVAPERGELTQTARRTILELKENRQVILGLAVVPD
jgi:Mrp family chromosome partitioning ATPase